MEVVIESLLAGARRATGKVAIIDVFRAFTTAAVALANRAARIVMVQSVEEALSLRAKGVGQICMGEVKGRAPEGFDFGNSPFAIKDIDFNGKTVIQRTSAGTQGIVSATRAAELYAASLVTAAATAKALGAGTSSRVTLVPMGAEGVERTDEDELCAIHLRNLLQGRSGDPEAIRRVILAGDQPPRFRGAARPGLHPADLDIALEIDRYDFAIKVEIEHERPVARVVPSR
jgi:2-phosphosulfolactate phosphatase